MRKHKPWAFWGSELSLLDLEANYYAREKENAMDNTFFSHDLMDKHAFELIKEWTFLIKKKKKMRTFHSRRSIANFPLMSVPAVHLQPFSGPESQQRSLDLLVGKERFTEQDGLCACALIYLACWCLQTTAPKHRGRWYGKPCTEHEVGCRNYVNGLE